MDEIYGIDSTTDELHEYADKALMSPENLMIPLDYYHYYYHSLINPVFGSSEELGLIQGLVASQSAASINIVHQNDEENHEQTAAYNPSIIKTKIASHPSYPRLLDAYIDCQKVGAPPETVCLLDEIIRLEKNMCKQDEVVSMCLGLDPELDQFMETYIEILGKYKADLSRPFDEAISFFNTIETQLGNLCIDYGGLSSDNGKQIQDTQMKTEDRELKDELLHKYGGEISSLKLKFTKKKKTVKLPKQARQTLVEWWNLHYKWPYPMEADKISLAETTGLDQKQISNWFINQRKRHWKSSENM